MSQFGFNFVLLGQFSSDPIERKFGVYRIWYGSNYFVSICQFLESNHAIRIRSLVEVQLLQLERHQTGYLSRGITKICKECFKLVVWSTQQPQVTIDTPDQEEDCESYRMLLD
eukprot:maker-scaffold77_size404793-snap-gene-0.18 protein:Tk04768 transcript:maker-scaffold77_size404793-snap-gene-0.18-mRNA-1 annotation:"hypothetical protein HELRODRAFT_162766"